MIQADHHANLLFGFFGLIPFTLFELAYPLYVVVIEELDTLQVLVVHGEELLQNVLIYAALGVVFANGGISPKLVDACDGADEVAVRHVGEGREVCLVATCG